MRGDQGFAGSASNPHAMDCPVAPAQDVAHATTSHSISQTKVAFTSRADQSFIPH